MQCRQAAHKAYNFLCNWSSMQETTITVVIVCSGENDATTNSRK